MTAAEWFASGRRIPYDPGSARVLSGKEAAATPGHPRWLGLDGSEDLVEAGNLTYASGETRHSSRQLPRGIYPRPDPASSPAVRINRAAPLPTARPTASLSASVSDSPSISRTVVDRRRVWCIERSQVIFTGRFAVRTALDAPRPVLRDLVSTGWRHSEGPSDSRISCQDHFGSLNATDPARWHELSRRRVRRGDARLPRDRATGHRRRRSAPTRRSWRDLRGRV